VARIRSLVPEIHTDSKLVACGPFARLLYHGMYNFADDYGVLPDDPESIGLKVLPADRGCVSYVELVEELLAAGKLARYEASDGRRYLLMVDWADEQKVKNPSTEKRFPAVATMRRVGATAPRGDGAALSPPPSVALRSPPAGAEQNGADRTGGERTGWERSGPDAQEGEAASGRPAAPPAPLSERSPSKTTADITAHFLERFYGKASPERRRDVERQLAAVVDSRSEGAKLRRGVFVKAWNAEHLRERAREVIEDPPRDPDKAIVVLLEKLRDPPPEPTPNGPVADGERLAAHSGHGRRGRRERPTPQMYEYQASREKPKWTT
jgi:hypothetical protein